MKTLKKNWLKALETVGLVGFAFVALYACISVSGQTTPSLSIVNLASNQIMVTVTNGTNTGLYQIYFADELATSNTDWTLLTNGTTGQTNFSFVRGDLEKGFFTAVNSSSGAPSLTVIILSPTNGSLIY